MTLRLLRPEVAGRDCRLCRRYEYDDDTGQARLTKRYDAETGRFERTPIERAPGTTPCELYRDGKTDTPCAKGHHEQQQDFDERSRAAYEHYVRRRAVGSFPDDPLVRWAAAIIATAENDARDRLATVRFKTMLQVLTAKG